MFRNCNECGFIQAGDLKLFRRGTRSILSLSQFYHIRLFFSILFKPAAMNIHEGLSVKCIKLRKWNPLCYNPNTDKPRADYQS